MSDMMRTYPMPFPSRGGARLRDPGAGVRRRFRQLVDGYRTYRAIRRKVRRLDQLSDEQLRDIGVNRRDLCGTGDRPLGGDPVRMYPRLSGLGWPPGR